jgi:exonuclease III
LEEITNHNINICAISETKKKGKGSQQMGPYTMIYSGKPKNERASAGVGLLLHQKFLPNIDKISYTSERILQTTLLVDNKHIELISVYAPDISKPRSECEDFYTTLQDTLDTIPQDHHIIIMGDLNARVGNDPIPRIKQRFNEEAQNDNGDLLIAFCTQ